MNILDENILEDQRLLLWSWGIRARQIGREIGRSGMKDQEIIPLLHRMRRSTFFTRDLGFYDQHLCHAKYCLVCLAASQYEAASLVRRFLTHPMFNEQAKRAGIVVRVAAAKIRVWRLDSSSEEDISWPG